MKRDSSIQVLNNNCFKYWHYYKLIIYIRYTMKSLSIRTSLSTANTTNFKYVFLVAAWLSTANLLSQWRISTLTDWSPQTEINENNWILSISHKVYKTQQTQQVLDEAFAWTATHRHIKTKLSTELPKVIPLFKAWDLQVTINPNWYSTMYFISNSSESTKIAFDGNWNIIRITFIGTDWISKNLFEWKTSPAIPQVQQPVQPSRIVPYTPHMWSNDVLDKEVDPTTIKPNKQPYIPNLDKVVSNSNSQLPATKPTPTPRITPTITPQKTETVSAGDGHHKILSRIAINGLPNGIKFQIGEQLFTADESEWVMLKQWMQYSVSFNWAKIAIRYWSLVREFLVQWNKATLVQQSKTPVSYQTKPTLPWTPNSNQLLFKWDWVYRTISRIHPKLDKHIALELWKSVEQYVMVKWLTVQPWLFLMTTSIEWGFMILLTTNKGQQQITGKYTRDWKVVIQG